MREPGRLRKWSRCHLPVNKALQRLGRIARDVSRRRARRGGRRRECSRRTEIGAEGVSGRPLTLALTLEMQPSSYAVDMAIRLVTAFRRSVGTSKAWCSKDLSQIFVAVCLGLQSSAWSIFSTQLDEKPTLSFAVLLNIENLRDGTLKTLYTMGQQKIVNKCKLGESWAAQTQNIAHHGVAH